MTNMMPNLQTIVAQFDIPNQVADPRPLSIGHINDSYVVPASVSGEPSYFLQRINHHVFTDVDSLQQNIFAVTRHIRKKLLERGVQDVDRRVLRLIPTKEGSLYFKTDEGVYWRLYLLIEGGESHDAVTPESACLAGEAFGEFQTMLADIPLDQVKESIPNFHNIEFRLHQLDVAIRDDNAGRVSSCQSIIDDILKRSEDMCQAERLHREGVLPKRINHCDTKVNNVMFAPDGSVLCIVDLDTVMPGYVLSDFGDFMRTAACTAAEDEMDLEKIHVDFEVFEAYTRGYLRKATFLTPIEKRLLPFGCKLLSYMQAVRFFTDYLQGDTYYKIAYPEHNLVRTKAQLRLLEEQERGYDRMMQIVEDLSK